MQDVLHVAWRVSPLAYPRVWRRCDHCKERRPFDCSGKFRINAQKKRLDVWLIYHCGRCGQTWNCPIHERRAVTDLDPALLQAYAANDADVARRHAFDLAGLQRHGGLVEAVAEVVVRKEMLDGMVRNAGLLVIDIALAGPCGLRLERLLTRELGLARSRVQALHREGALALAPAGRKLLRQPPRDGQSVTLHLARLSDLAVSILDRAIG
jgi:hypothetical protein